jgi:hypothetical protein
LGVPPRVAALLLVRIPNLVLGFARPEGLFFFALAMLARL